jgi:ribosomal protein L11 methyltransferase
MAQTYAKATFKVPAAMADDVAGFLVSKGALGCSVAEMDKPGQRPRKILTLEAWFPAANGKRAAGLYGTMRNAGMLANQARAARLKKVSDPGWATKWQERFKPFRVGKQFLIVPPWDRKQTRGRITLTIVPGFGFGTGHHPTTAGALRAIESLFAGNGGFERALDVGTGSGVLAFSIAALGTPVTAIDIDQQALQNARENAKLNPAPAKIRFSATPLARINGRFDLIAANILSTVLTELAPQLIGKLKRGGRIILSGIVASEVRDLLPAYRRLRLIAVNRSRGWATIVMAK